MLATTGQSSKVRGYSKRRGCGYDVALQEKKKLKTTFQNSKHVEDVQFMNNEYDTVEDLEYIKEVKIQHCDLNERVASFFRTESFDDLFTIFNPLGDGNCGYKSLEYFENNVLNMKKRVINEYHKDLLHE